MVNVQKPDYLIPEFDGNEISGISRTTKDRVKEIIELDDNNNESLFKLVLQTRIYGYLRSADKGERINKQTLFFNKVAENIKKRKPELIDSSTYSTINTDFPGCSSNLNSLLSSKVKRSLGNKNLLYFIDLFLESEYALNGIIDFKTKKINKQEVVRGLIYDMDEKEQDNLINEIAVNTGKKERLRTKEGTVVNLIGGFNEQTSRKKPNIYLKGKTNKVIYPEIADRISIILTMRPNLGGTIIDEKIRKYEKDENKSEINEQKENIEILEHVGKKFNISNDLLIKIKQYKLINNITKGEKQEISSNQRKLFEKIASKLEISGESIPNILYKKYWLKRDNQITLLNKLFKEYKPLTGHNLKIILDNIFFQSNKENIDNIVEEVDINEKNIVEFIIFNLDLDEQKILLSQIYKSISKHKNLKKYSNIEGSKIGSTIKNFLTPLIFGYDPYKIREQINNTVIGNTKMSNSVLELLIIRMFQEKEVLMDILDLLLSYVEQSEQTLIYENLINETKNKYIGIIENLQRDIVEQKNGIQELTTQNRVQNRSLQRYIQVRDEQRVKISRLGKQLRKAKSNEEKCINKMEIEKAGDEEKIGALLVKLSQLKEKIICMEDEKAGSKKQINSLSIQANKLQKIIDEMRNRKSLNEEKIKNLLTQINQLKEKIDEITSEKSIYEKQIKKFLIQVNQLKEKIICMEGEKAGSKKQIKNLGNKVKTRQKRIDKMTDEKDGDKEQISILLKKMSKLELDIKGHITENSNYEEQIKNNNLLIEELQKKNSSNEKLGDEIKNKKDEKLQLDNIIEELKKSIKDLTTPKFYDSALGEKNKALESRIEQLECDLRRECKTNRALNKERTENAKTKDELERNIWNLQTKLRRKEEELLQKTSHKETGIDNQNNDIQDNSINDEEQRYRTEFEKRIEKEIQEEILENGKKVREELPMLKFQNLQRRSKKYGKKTPKK